MGKLMIDFGITVGVERAGEKSTQYLLDTNFSDRQ